MARCRSRARAISLDRDLFARWLAEALPRLKQASADCDLGGDALLHMDVRSDNLCIRGDRAVLVDWNHACVGNPLLDSVAWAPSLRTEGGPEPWALVSIRTVRRR